MILCNVIFSKSSKSLSNKQKLHQIKTLLKPGHILRVGQERRWRVAKVESNYDGKGLRIAQHTNYRQCFSYWGLGEGLERFNPIALLKTLQLNNGGHETKMSHESSDVSQAI